MRTLLLACFSLCLVLALPAFGAPEARKAPTPAPNFEPSGIAVGQDIIRPGEALSVLFGMAGPPDHVRALRGKKEKDDYVMFSYYSQGFSIDINSADNRIQGILVESREVRLHGIPFHVGDDRDAALKAWGEPDRTDKGVMAYWRRGVYVGVGEGGRIVNLFIAPPGRVEETDGRPAEVRG